MTGVQTCALPIYGSPELDGLRVRVRGEWLAVIGSPRPYDAAACPTAWNMQVKVGCAHG